WVVRHASLNNRTAQTQDLANPLLGFFPPWNRSASRLLPFGGNWLAKTWPRNRSSIHIPEYPHIKAHTTDRPIDPCCLTCQEYCFWLLRCGWFSAERRASPFFHIPLPSSQAAIFGSRGDKSSPHTAGHTIDWLFRLLLPLLGNSFGLLP